MRIDPLKQKRNTLVGLVLKGGLQVAGEWQGTSWNDVPANAKLYVSRTSDVMPLVHSGTGKVRVWRNEKITGFELFGRRVSNLRGLLPSHSSDELLHELIRFADWLRSYGANIGSMSGSGWSLWRATLDSALICYGEEPPPDALLHGGRQGEKPGVYENIAIWDLTAAYAHTVGKMLIPTEWKRYQGEAWPECGYIEATVTIPRMEWGPLPIKEGEVVSYPANTTLTGVWTIDELRAAQENNCEVKIASAWTSTSHTKPFANWWEIISKGRQELGGGCAKLVKSCSNTLWGKFLSGGSADWRYFVDGEMIIVPEKWNEKPRSPALAGMVAGRVRARLFTEALTKHPVIACHTDGVITPDTEHLSPNTGAPGRWRLKDAGNRLELVSAQAFRYKTDGGRYTYRLSGIKPEDAPRVFSKMMRPFRRPKPDLPRVEYNDLFYDKWEAPPDLGQTALPGLEVT